MKNFFKLLGIIALAAVIGFSFSACPEETDDDEDILQMGAGKYAGKDVLGNSYSLSVGSDARAAVKGDSFKMSVNTRGGTKNINGTVTNVSADGTLTLKESGTNAEFTARVGGTTSLDSVASSDLTQAGFAPRTFDNIFLRAMRWNNPDPVNPQSGENWGSGTSVLVKDFPAKVSGLVTDNERYSIKISGTSNVKMEHIRIEVQGLTEDDEWVFLAGSNIDAVFEANSPFNKTIALDNVKEDVPLNFMEYKEIILQITDVLKYTSTTNPEWNMDNGSIPANIPNSYIMATISNFKIVLEDSKRTAVTGNMGDFTYALKEDGLSYDYKYAVWSLSADNIAKAKQAGAKLVLEMGITGEEFEEKGAALAFIWQDPNRNLWWQDQSALIGNVQDGGGNWNFTVEDGITWDKGNAKLTIPLDAVIEDSKFADATQVNFLIACWWFGADNFCIDGLYKTANIVTE